MRSSGTPAVPLDYGWMLYAGVALNFVRGIGLFVGAFALSAEGAPLILVELAGALYFLPMLFGNGYRRIPGFTRGQSAVTSALRGCAAAAGIIAVLGVVAAVGDPTTWLVLMFMTVLGSGNLINIALRLPLLQTMIGRRSSQRYMAIEAISSAVGALIGPLAGGAVIALTGVGSSLILTAGVLASAAVALLVLRRRAADVDPAAPPQRLGDDLRILRGNRSLQQVLAVTVLMNMGFFAAVPVVPFIAHERGMDPVVSGWLASMVGLGGLLGAILLALLPSLEPRRIYLISSILALVAFAVFVLVDAGPGSFAILVIAGLGQAGFTVQQPVLALLSVEPDDRLTAMGLLSLGVGTLPLGVLLTHVAQLLVAPTIAVAITCAIAAAGVPLVSRERSSLRTR
ncbi:MFS transporter [Microbacterium esteraromaticum]|uniref:MFS transporter n=1 Tax=Microbacterium esteraromaticum TaxID=57043 RepID=A0A7D8AH75_9MICO|nr:MFS transporter [Microbacterium esteraromaticum]QMU95965.1 MFS transporter [Microbacterium esteraromaticum]